MQCPACHGSLQEKPFKYIRVDVCSGCHGIWFDYAEMKAACDTASFDEVDREFPGTYREVPVTEAMTEPARQCPRDATTMVRHEWSADSRIVMDYCPHCCGTWLDAGELEGYTAILKNLEENPPRASIEQLAELETLRAADSKAVRDFVEANEITPIKVLKQILRFYVPR